MPFAAEPGNRRKSPASRKKPGFATSQPAQFVAREAAERERRLYVIFIMANSSPWPAGEYMVKTRVSASFHSLVDRIFIVVPSFGQGPSIHVVIVLVLGS
jgi:hypothetical protein